MSTPNSHHPDSHRSIMKSTSIFSLGTLASRILGFFRDIILAKILGTGFRADALFVAFRIPNLLRNFVGEGATNSAVVPVFSEYLAQKKKEDFAEFVSVVLLLALMCLSLITVLGIFLAPWIVRFIAPGFMADPAKLALTVSLTRIIFPYLVFIGLTAYSMAILYTYRSFTAPAFSPCLLNISIIISALLSSWYMKEPVYGLALGIVVGGILQLAVQIYPLWKTGVRFKKPKTLRHPGALKVGRLLLPRMVGAGVYQMTVLVDTFCASLSAIVGVGGISAVYYANRIIQFPMGIFTIALVSAVLPTLSGFANNGHHEEMKKTLSFSLESIFFVMFPTSIIMAILADPIIRVLFERGEFNAYSTHITSSALLFYAIGLFSFGGIKILVTAFHSLQDTKTPVQVAAVCLAVNAALNFILMGPMKVSGIALASSVAATIDLLLLFYFLRKRLGPIFETLYPFVFKTLSAAFIMGACIYAEWKYFPVPSETLKLAVVGVSGYVIYGILSFQLKVEQSRKFYYWIVRQGSRF